MLRGRVCLYQLCFPLYKGPLRAGLLRYGDVNSHLRGFSFSGYDELNAQNKITLFFLRAGVECLGTLSLPPHRVVASSLCASPCEFSPFSSNLRCWICPACDCIQHVAHACGQEVG
jgi:hypothetical protein